jgi:Flp pilus assembly pilin Flp
MTMQGLVGLYVRCHTAVSRAVRRVREEQAGLTMIEYGVAAAFLVLALVGAAVLVGPQLKNWLVNTVNDIVNGRGS